MVVHTHHTVELDNAKLSVVICNSCRNFVMSL